MNKGLADSRPSSHENTSTTGRTDPLTVDIRLLSIPTLTDMHTSRDGGPSKPRSANSKLENTTNRQLTVIRFEDSDGSVGWGECSALNELGYSNESAMSSFHTLTGTRDPDRDQSPMAAAAVEMARLDLRLRKAGQSLAQSLGITRTQVKAGAVLGLMTPDESVITAGQLVKQGYQRVKVKISPTQVELIPAVLRMTFPELEIQVDANGSLDESHMEQLVELAELGVTAIEQPFPLNRSGLTRDLIVQLDELAESEAATVAGIPAVIADESAPNLEAAKRLWSEGALSGVSIKPPRVGGLSRALELLAWCVAQGIPTTAGGMLESALGRHALAAFAANDGLEITGDVSPSRRWLATDPWPDLKMSDGMIPVPTSPGIAPLPDQDLIEDLTVYRWTGSS